MAITDVPKALMEPPWARKPAAPDPSGDEPIIVPGLEPPAGRAVVWAPGERKEWAATRSHESWQDDRKVGDDRYVVLNLSPGIQVGYVDMDPVQKIEHVWIGTRPDDHYRAAVVEDGFAAVNPVMISEVLADLTGLAEAAV